MEALLEIETIRALHDEILLPENIPGEREGRLEGVHGRIEARVYYLEIGDVFDVAAITGTYLAMGHAFVDGNKRTAFACIDVILAVAGAPLEYSDPPEEDPLFSIIIQCAQGILNENHLADYLRKRYISTAGLTMPGEGE
jgi:death-on-curing protein